jgi:hypothetical protein
MKQIIFYIFFFSSLGAYCQKHLLRGVSNQDTVVINYSIAAGEFGSMHKGIILIKKNDQVWATHVLYNYGVSLLANGIIDVAPNSSIPMNKDSILAFYHTFKNDFTILKQEWVLNDEQVECLDKFLEEAEKFKQQGFSNAPEYYAVIAKNRELIILDRSGKWNKHKTLEIILDL